jgi:exopolysaccharide biosynthesis polyprenyl glycosylphosphotransferase
MLKTHSRAVATTIFTADLIVTLTSFFAAFGLIDAAAPMGTVQMLLPIENYLWLLLFIVPVWAMFLQWSGTYQSHRTKPIVQDLLQVSRAAILGGVALFAFVGLMKASHISRPFLFAFSTVNLVALVLLRIALRTTAHAVRARGLNTRSVLIVGTGTGAKAHSDRISANPQWGHRLAGFISVDDVAVQDAAPKEKVLGNPSSIRRVLCEYVVDEVVVAVPPDRLASVEPILMECETAGVKTRLALDFPHRIARMEVEDMDGYPMLTFSATPAEDASMMTKRAMDIVFSSLFLLSFSWLYGLIAVVLKLTSKGPVFFRQERVGMNGRRFTFFKFRSMVVDADRRKDELKHLNEMDGPVFKIKNDPRVTRVGRFLRKFSLDELPQMWNVLKGDMSLVGPRPPVPSEVEKYEFWARRRLSIRPGLTCLWQISGRNSINFQQWMELDLQYIDNWTLGLDFKILLKTVPAVLGGRGAS